MILDVDNLVKALVKQVRHNLTQLTMTATKSDPNPSAVIAAAAKYQESLTLLQKLPLEFYAKDNEVREHLKHITDKQLDQAEMEVFTSNES